VSRRTIAPYDDAPCNAVAFDHSALFLAVGGTDARVYAAKQEFSQVSGWREAPPRSHSWTAVVLRRALFSWSARWSLHFICCRAYHLAWVCRP